MHENRINYFHFKKIKQINRINKIASCTPHTLTSGPNLGGASDKHNYITLFKNIHIINP